MHEINARDFHLLQTMVRSRNMLTQRNEPRDEISNNVVRAASKGSDQPAHTRSLIRVCSSLEYALSVNLLTEQHFEFLSYK